MSNPGTQAMMFGLQDVKPKRKAVTLRQQKAYLADCVRCGGFVLPSVAAEWLGVSRQYVAQMIDEGKLPIREHLGRRWVEGNALLELIQERKDLTKGRRL